MLGLGTFIANSYVSQGGAAGYTATNTYSVAMDGSNDRIDTVPFTSTIQGSFSIAFWAKFPSHSSDEFLVGLSNSVYDGGWITYRFYIERQTDGSVRWVFTANDGQVIIDSTATGLITDDTWHHVIMSVEKTGTGSTASDFKICIDGSAINLRISGTVTAAQQGNWTSGSSKVQIGAYSNNVTEVTAWFDWGIWSTHMDDSNAAAIYNSGVPIDITSDSGNYNKSSSMVTYYKLDEGTGTTAADSVGSNDASLINGASWVTVVPS